MALASRRARIVSKNYQHDNRRRKTIDSSSTDSRYRLLPHLARGAAINFSGIFFRTAFVYLYTFILARMLSVEDLGQFFLMSTIINLLGLAGMVGLDLGVVRYVSLFLGEKKFSMLRRSVRAGAVYGIPVGVVLAALLFFAAPALSRIFLDGTERSSAALQVFALALPFMVAARLFNATTQGMHRMQYQVYSRDIGEQIFKVVVSLLLLTAGASLMGVVVANVAAIMAASGMSLMFALIILPKRNEAAEPESLARATASAGGTGFAVAKSDRDSGVSPGRLILKYSLPLAFANVLVALWLQVDILLLGFFSSSEDVGFYGVAMKMALFITKSITAFGTVFTPIIADLWNRGRTEELGELYITISRWIFTISFPLFLILVLFSNSILAIFGSQYEAGSGALIILAGGQLLSAITGAAGIMLLMSGRSKLELLNVSVALAVNVLLCVLLIPPYGVIGAAIAHMSAIVILNLIRVTEILFFMKMFAYDVSILKPVFAGLGGAAVALLIGRFMNGYLDIVQLGILALILLIFYVFAMIVLGLNQQDKLLLSKIKASTARFRATGYAGKD